MPINNHTPINNRPIGIFDSGVGGLSVLSAIHQLMPNENLIYVADSEHTPYGDKSAPEIERRVVEITRFLVRHKIKLLVVACNTATAAAVKHIREQYNLPIIGLEPALKPAALNSKNGRVGILATQATLNSQKYQKLKKEYGSQLELVEKASPLFVELVENGTQITAKEIQLIENELQPFKQANVDSLVLGCTHYPFLTATIVQSMGSHVTLFESASPVAKEVQRRLKDNFSESVNKGHIDYFSSEPEKSQTVFERLLGKKILLNHLNA